MRKSDGEGAEDEGEVLEANRAHDVVVEHEGETDVEDAANGGAAWVAGGEGESFLGSLARRS